MLKALIILGVALQGQGRLEEAIEAFNKALSVKPDYAEIYNNMGVALAKANLKKQQGAKEAVAIMLPDFADAYWIFLVHLEILVVSQKNGLKNV